MNYTLAHFLDFLHNRFEIRIKSGYSFGAMERKMSEQRRKERQYFRPTIKIQS
jgi:hypothetical protein